MDKYPSDLLHYYYCMGHWLLQSEKYALEVEMSFEIFTSYKRKPLPVVPTLFMLIHLQMCGIVFIATLGHMKPTGCRLEIDGHLIIW